MEKVKMIKKDALIKIEIGAGILQKLQIIISQLIANKTDEEISNFQDLVKQKNTTFPEEWMEQVFLLSFLVQHIESEAEKQNQTYEKELSSNTPDS